MKSTLNYFDRLMAAITFAEANEPELVREFTDDCKPAQTTPGQGRKMTGGGAQKKQAIH